MAVSSDRDPQTYAVIGAAIEVHKTLGPGFLEAVYQESMGIELAERHIPHVREAGLTVAYKGISLKAGYRADFVCYGDLLIEVKAQSSLTAIDEAQLLNYLKATTFKRGLLINFGEASLAWKRMVL